ncbi:hypothetical protein nbrc107696_29930 [Gordonia spumicola]|uniref:Pyrrolo-quinoline quinone repeat domain-containing protein n=1 Tax=Gordonia spumicola TaxID=589161 RepID=A0A7I9VB15_9ACTN|nr:PQQ-binding-like beta-propeller repeat protein [Gordonia spumicola]GEE02547.1 hypothetical protein nbrc107696_29930 [Gordonia spumicola]
MHVTSESDERTRNPLMNAAPKTYAAGLAAAVAGTALSIAAIVGRGPTSAISGVDHTLLVIAAVSLVAMAGSAAGVWWTVRGTAVDGGRAADRRADTVGVAAQFAAWLGVAALGIVAVQIGSKRDVIVLVDENAATVCTFLGAACALTVLACLSAASRRTRRGRVETTVGRGRVVGTVIAATTVIATAAATLVASELSHVVHGPDRIEAVDVPPVPSDLGVPGERSLIIEEGRTTPTSVGPGFMMATDRTVTAYDGLTGRIRWFFDGSAISTGDISTSVLAEADGDVVVVSGDLLTVGLDGNTGRLLWRSADTGGSGWSPMVEVRNPRTRQLTATVDLSCSPPNSVTVSYVVWMSCLRAGDLMLVERSSGVERSVSLPDASHARVAEIEVVGRDVLAVEYWSEPDPNLSSPPRRFVIVDAVRGEVIDDFETTATIASISEHGVMVLHDADLRGLSFRDTATKRTVVPTQAGLALGTAGAWVGERYAVGGSDGEIRLVDPSTGTVGVRHDICSRSGYGEGYVSGITPVPGAVLVQCRVTSPQSATETVAVR